MRTCKRCESRPVHSPKIKQCRYCAECKIAIERSRRRVYRNHHKEKLAEYQRAYYFRVTKPRRKGEQA